jgi:phosphodiesterase/alkaline phosphatase D-like protein
MIVFFINGALKVTTHDNRSTTYEMRFLTETLEDTQVRITMYDDFDNTTEHIQQINGLVCIKIDCTDYLDKFNWQNNTYLRIKYTVDVKDKVQCKGSFPLISPDHKDTLKFVSVSCNNNKKLNDSNHYAYSKVPNTVNMWSKIEETNNVDVIFHTGNQIYGDYIVDNNIGFTNMRRSCNTDHIYQTYANLYRTAYGEKSQGTAMRNSLNIMTMNDHDIYQHFESNKSDILKKPYYLEGMSAYLNYQHQLHSDTPDNQQILNGDKPIYYDLHYGKYHIFGLDQRNEVYHNKTLLSDTQLYWLFFELTNTKSTNIILVSPLPIGYLNKANAFIRGVFTATGKDELLHPDNYDRTSMLLDNLAGFKNSKDIMLISGCANRTFINAIYKTDELELSESVVRRPVVRQLSSGPITRTPLQYGEKTAKIGEWLQNKKVCFNMENLSVSPKIAVSNNNSYGVIERDQMYNVFLEDDENIFIEDNVCNSMWCSKVLCFR